MYLVAYGAPFSLPGQPAYLRLENGGDLLISVEANHDGSPDWSDASLADPRGIPEIEWEMCGAFIAALRLATTANLIQAIDRGEDWMCDCDGRYRNPNAATECGSCGSLRPDLLYATSSKKEQR